MEYELILDILKYIKKQIKTDSENVIKVSMREKDFYRLLSLDEAERRLDETIRAVIKLVE